MDSETAIRESLRKNGYFEGRAAAFSRNTLQQSHETLLPVLLPDTFRTEFGAHHDRYWQYVWSIKDQQQARDYVAPWPRGQAKSSSLEATSVVFAGRKARRHALYCCATQFLANTHLAAIEAKMGASTVREMYPDVGTPKLTTIGTQRAWRQDVLSTEHYTIRALGLDVAGRGLKSDDDYRPDVIFLDEIDLLDDSATEVLRKLNILRLSILPSLALPYGIVIFGQNLIHSDSVMSQVLDGRSSLLSHAIKDDPLPSLLNLEYEERMEQDDRGVYRKVWIITKGEPTWVGQGIAECQAYVDRTDMDSFLREMQQEVNRPKVGALFSMFDERYSVITWSEFQMLYGQIATDKNGEPRIPAVGYLGNYQDIGGTVAHPNVNLWMWRPEAGMRLSDSVFVYRELVLPEYPEPVTTDPSLLTVATAIHQLEAPWQEGMPGRMTRQISHEGNTEARFYGIDLPKVRDENTGLMMKGLRYAQWNPQKTGGIGILQSYMKVIEQEHTDVCPHKHGATGCTDWLHAESCPHRAIRQTGCWAQQHPFRPYMWGRPRIYLIVADDQGALEGGRQRQPYDARGLARLRAEIPRYTEDKTKGGSGKIFDDAIDCLRKASESFFIPIARPKEEDQVQAAIPPAYRRDAPAELVAALPADAQKYHAQIQYYLEHNARSKVQEQRKSTAVLGYHSKIRRARSKG